MELNSRNPKKAGSKPERCERVYKRAVKAQRDLSRKEETQRNECTGGFSIEKSPQTIYSLRRRGGDGEI